jgi:predicted dinucleotide-binding enzyme
MKIGVLGTGMVGNAIATKLVGLGHEVMMGSRSAGNERAAEWVAAAGTGASQGTFGEAAAHGELVFNCTAGEASLDAIGSAVSEHLAGKVLVDVSNPLDHSQGMPPVLFVSSSDSLGEQIQRAFPDARVVKALNTVNCEVMVDPGKVPGEHDVFVCGNDDAAKATVIELLQDFSWPAEHILDLGDITSARGTEGYLLLWTRLWGALQTGYFNVRVVR